VTGVQGIALPRSQHLSCPALLESAATPRRRRLPTCRSRRRPEELENLLGVPGPARRRRHAPCPGGPASCTNRRWPSWKKRLRGVTIPLKWSLPENELAPGHRESQQPGPAASLKASGNDTEAAKSRRKRRDIIWWRPLIVPASSTGRWPTDVARPGGTRNGEGTKDYADAEAALLFGKAGGCVTIAKVRRRQQLSYIRKNAQSSSDPTKTDYEGAARKRSGPPGDLRRRANPPQGIASCAGASTTVHGRSPAPRRPLSRMNCATHAC